MPRKRANKPSKKRQAEVEPLTPIHIPEPFEDGEGEPAEPLHIPDLPVPGLSISPFLAHELRKYIGECARRKIEGLKLYEPLPIMQRFHASTARVNVIRGSNRSGKTLAAAVEVSRAVTGADPFDKYPKTNGRIYCVGADTKHLGETMYRKLFMPGAFKMIKDLSTRAWRSYRPWNASDRARLHCARDSAPLIPGRLVADWSWGMKKENIPSMIKLTNGWEMVFFSSLGKPPRGSDIDIWWFDEEIVDEDWYPEMVARILDRHGRGIWSATPQAGTDQLFELHEQAEKTKDDENALVREFVSLVTENPHMTDEEKDFMKEVLSEEELSVRFGGDFAINAYKVYPEFSTHVHVVDPGPEWQVPLDWTLYAVTDPGYQRCATLFAAVPPPTVGDYLYLWDELYLKNCGADTFGLNFAIKVKGKQFQQFLIDPKGSALTDLGSGKSVLSQYTAALENRGVRSMETGSSFRLAIETRVSGLLAVHSLLALRPGGDCKLRIVKGRTPKLLEEFKLYHNKRVGGRVTEQPEAKNNHLMDCLRYLAMANPRYVRPAVGKPPQNAVVRAFRLKQQKKQKSAQASMNHLGPGRGV